MNHICIAPMKSLIATSILAVLTSMPLAAAPQAPAKADRAAIGQYNLEKGLALSGFDPVAYFKVGGGKPKEGKKSLTAKHRGVTYRFASEDNRAQFLITPERFEPAYGGWCAYAMSGGEKVEVDPERFKIEGGRLHVFYDGFFGPNTLKKWNSEGPEKLAPKASASWKKFSKEVTPDLRHYNVKQGIGLSGFDPVSYFADGATRPTAGKESLAATHGGVTYRFATDANRQAFLKSPERYVSKYGGYCAWAMSQGKKVEVDPSAFVLTDGKLHLFYNASKRDAWTAEVTKLQPAAEKEWKSLHAGS